MFGRFSFRGDQSPVDLSLEKSGGATMVAVGFIRSLLRTRFKSMTTPIGANCSGADRTIREEIRRGPRATGAQPKI